MREHKSAGPLRACVKVADYCDSCSTGTLTCVKSFESAFPNVSEQFVIEDCFFSFGEDN
jgi:hypothetical protein